jgi:hypothetical protein
MEKFCFRTLTCRLDHLKCIVTMSIRHSFLLYSKSFTFRMSNTIQYLTLMYFKTKQALSSKNIRETHKNERIYLSLTSYCLKYSNLIQFVDFIIMF